MARKYYSLDNILSHNCIYNFIIGERSNGKTTAVLEYGVKQYWENGGEFAIIRRMDEDFKNNNARTLFSGLEKRGVIEHITHGKFTGVTYYGGAWYLSNETEQKNGELKTVKAPTPFAYAFALSQGEHYKSTSFPNVTTILFDEVITRDYYLNDEFILFQNLLSTIIRDRDNVKIFMLGNTITKFCPYFNEMGLKHISQMEMGKIDVYVYGESGLSVAVEYTDTAKHSAKSSDKYFSFDNPRLKMITTGAFELKIYPHKPVDFKPKDIVFTYFIDFDTHLLQCEIVKVDNAIFTFIHRKTTPIKNPDHDLVFQQNYDARPNYRRKINRPIDKLGERIYYFFKTDSVYYADNEIGDIVENYLKWAIDA